MPDQQEESTQTQFQQLQELEAIRAAEQYQEAEKSAQAQASKTPRMSGFLFLMLFIPCLIADIVDVFTAGTIGWLIGLVVDILLLVSLGFTKGRSRSQVQKVLVGFGLETVLPFINVVPFRTLGLIWAYLSPGKHHAGKPSGTIATAQKAVKFFVQ